MLPDVDATVYEVIDNSQLPTKTYKIENNRIIGFIDKQEAYIQAVYLLLNTERFDYIIYSWNYGVELKDLIGKEMYFVTAMFQKAVREALLVDKRTVDIYDFTYEIEKNVIKYKFKVKSIYDEAEIERSIII